MVIGCWNGLALTLIPRDYLLHPNPQLLQVWFDDFGCFNDKLFDELWIYRARQA
jgi:hypothetical protein